MGWPKQFVLGLFPIAKTVEHSASSATVIFNFQGMYKLHAKYTKVNVFAILSIEIVECGQEMTSKSQQGRKVNMHVKILRPG